MSKDTASKTQQLAEAARLRTKVEREAAESVAPAKEANTEANEEIKANKREHAEDLASIRPQAIDKSLDGIDPDAMGDVKGDGGDAKNYPDGDPDKALGVPTYEHGLKEDRVGGGLNRAVNTAFGHRQSSRTQDEMNRGKEAIGQAKTSRPAPRKGSTVVTDANEDPDGDNGKTAAEKRAAEAKAKASAS